MELLFEGTNLIAVRSFEIFNFADLSLERKLEPFCDLFDLCFSHLQNFVET